MLRLSDKELAIMKVMWEAGKPIPRKYLQDQLSYLNWKPHTFNTYLSRMQEKGFIDSNGQVKGQTYLFWPLIKQEAYSEQIGTNLLDQLFNGSIKNFVAALSGTDAIDRSDLDELRSYLAEMEEGDHSD